MKPDTRLTRTSSRDEGRASLRSEGAGSQTGGLGGLTRDGRTISDHRAHDKVQARLARRLEALGFEVTVTQRVEAAS